MRIPDRQGPSGPFDLADSQSHYLEREFLGLEPFGDGTWLEAIERYLLLRWVLGRRPTTAKEICAALYEGQFYRTKKRPFDSGIQTVHRVLRSNRKYRTPGYARRGARLYALNPSRHAMPSHFDE